MWQSRLDCYLRFRSCFYIFLRSRRSCRDFFHPEHHCTRVAERNSSSFSKAVKEMGGRRDSGRAEEGRGLGREYLDLLLREMSRLERRKRGRNDSGHRVHRLRELAVYSRGYNRGKFSRSNLSLLAINGQINRWIDFRPVRNDRQETRSILLKSRLIEEER